MEDAVFENKLNDLIKQIQDFPPDKREHLMSLAKKTEENHKELKKKVQSLHESLDYLRVSLKYLIFDLEATRRENACLRKQLDDTNKNS